MKMRNGKVLNRKVRWKHLDLKQARLIQKRLSSDSPPPERFTLDE